VVDSIIFLWLAFGSLEFLLGQIVGKAWMVLLSNLVFLTLAGALAYRRGVKHLVAGMCETDYSGYPDCRDGVWITKRRSMPRLSASCMAPCRSLPGCGGAIIASASRRLEHHTWRESIRSKHNRRVRIRGIHRRSRPIGASQPHRTGAPVDSTSSAVNLKFLSLLAASSFRNFKFKTALES
jgi:Queuosine biosynthesis protein QueC